MYREFLIMASFLLVNYCVGINVISEVRSHDDIIGQFLSLSLDDRREIKIIFASQVPSDERTRILNAAFDVLLLYDLAQHIEHLDLSDNALTVAPVINEFTSLRILQLTNNELIESPDLTALIELEELYLDKNKLSIVPSLAGLTGLKWLDLADNELRVPPSLAGLITIETIYLNNNQLQSSPDLTGLISLEELDLSNNNLKYPPNLAGLSSLRQLDLSENLLIRPPIITNDLVSLEKLILSHNPLTVPASIPAVLEGEVSIEGVGIELLDRSMSGKQKEQILPTIVKLANEFQAEIAINAWLSQQDTSVQGSATNIVFAGPQLFFAQGANTVRSLEYMPVLMNLPIRSIHALLISLYGNYDINQVPLTDPIKTSIEFTVNGAELNKLIDHFVERYQLPPLIENEKELLQSNSQQEPHYALSKLVRLIRHKLREFEVPEYYLSWSKAVAMLKEAFPNSTNQEINTVLRPLLTPAGIKRAGLVNFIRSRKKLQTQISQ